jgi:hypothetical protein
LFIKTFPRTPKAHSNSSKNFSYDLIFSEEIIQYSRTFAPQVQTPWNQAHAPLLVQRFPRRPRTRSQHPGLVDLTVTNKTKQTNNLPSYINNALHSWSDTTKDIEKSFTM